MALYMYHMLHYHNNVINIYNSFNEYLFYENSMMYNTLVLDFLEQTINETYDIKFDLMQDVKIIIKN